MHLRDARKCSATEREVNGGQRIDCDRCKDQSSSSSFSVQENDFKSNLIAITGDNSGDTQAPREKKRKDVQDCRAVLLRVR